MNALRRLKRQVAKLESHVEDSHATDHDLIDGLHVEIERLEAGDSAGAAEQEEAEGFLRGCVELHTVVTFKYRDAEDETSYRMFSPWQVRETAGRFLSAVGYDHGRDGVRHFRIARIEGAVHPVPPEVEEYIRQDGE